MYHAYCALGCLLIALAAGTALLVYVEKHAECCKKLSKAIGYVVIVLSIAGMVGLGANAIYKCKKGCDRKAGSEKSCCLKKGNAAQKAPATDSAKD